MGEDEAAVVLVLRVPDGLLLGQGLGQRLVGRRGRGRVGQLLRAQAVMPTTVQSDSGKRGRLSATSNFVLMAAIMVPARAGLTIHGASLKVERELHPLVLIVRSRVRQQDLEADLGEEGQPNCQQVLEPVHSSRMASMVKTCCALSA